MAKKNSFLTGLLGAMVCLLALGGLTRGFSEWDISKWFGNNDESDDLVSEEASVSVNYEIDGYSLLDLNIYRGYYQSSKGNYIMDENSDNYSTSWYNAFLCTDKFTIDDLPIGTMFVVEDGFNVRPEGWIDEETLNTNSTRPTNLSSGTYYVDDSFFSNFTIRAFNISYEDNSSSNPLNIQSYLNNIDSIFRIYIPE